MSFALSLPFIGCAVGLHIQGLRGQTRQENQQSNILLNCYLSKILLLFVGVKVGKVHGGYRQPSWPNSSSSRQLVAFRGLPAPRMSTEEREEVSGKIKKEPKFNFMIGNRYFLVLQQNHLLRGSSFCVNLGTTCSLGGFSRP